MSKYYAEIIDHVLERSGDTNANCQHNSLKGKLISGINLTIVLSNWWTYNSLRFTLYIWRCNSKKGREMNMCTGEFPGQIKKKPG